MYFQPRSSRHFQNERNGGDSSAPNTGFVVKGLTLDSFNTVASRPSARKSRDLQPANLASKRSGVAAHQTASAQERVRQPENRKDARHTHSFNDHFTVLRKSDPMTVTPSKPVTESHPTQDSTHQSNSPKGVVEDNHLTSSDRTCEKKSPALKSILTPFHLLKHGKNVTKPGSRRFFPDTDPVHPSNSNLCKTLNDLQSRTPDLSACLAVTSGGVRHSDRDLENANLKPCSENTVTKPQDKNMPAALESLKLHYRRTGLVDQGSNRWTLRKGSQPSSLDNSVKSDGQPQSKSTAKLAEADTPRPRVVSAHGDVPSKTAVSMVPANKREKALDSQAKLWTRPPALVLDKEDFAPGKGLDPPILEPFGYGLRHPLFVHRTIHMRYGSNDFSSPLGSFHAPIKPYLMPGLSTDMIGSFNAAHNHLPSIFVTCGQIYPIPLQLVIDHLVNVRKVGEGVYGEVYKAYYKGMPDPMVYKIVPIEGEKIVNGEKQKRFIEIEPEIIIAQELNKLRFGLSGCFTDGHCRLLNARICKGKYPKELVDQWKSWHKTCVSQNDLPEFDGSQLYAALEFEYHGTDIETFKFKNAKQSMAVLLHVIHALAVAEAGLQFEHRDLHWGNILVLKTRELYTTYSLNGTRFQVPNCGLKSTIIDYTISRLTNSVTGCPVYTDLSNDGDQFCGSEDYQFEIYRMMRTENNNEWSAFHPKTNVFWMHYLVGKLIEKGRYSETTSGVHYHFKNKLLRIQAGILKYNSCVECVQKFIGPYVRDLESD